MRMPAVTLAAALALLLAAGAGTSSTTTTGLQGVVMRGPTQPVCHVGEPCQEPAKRLLLQFRRDGVLRAQVRTNDKGRYAVRLAPGRYSVTTPRLRPGQTLSPQLVRVPHGRVGRVNFTLETSIQ